MTAWVCHQQIRMRRRALTSYSVQPQNQSDVRWRPVSYVHWNPSGLHDHPYSIECHAGSPGPSALQAVSMRLHPARM
jgi:hypothetical protein